MFDFLKRWTKTEHELCREDLSAFLDGRLITRERARMERHLEECAACRADLEALRRTVALLRTVPAVKLPRFFLIPAREMTRQRQAQRQRLAYVYLQAATAVATVLLVLVVSGDALLRYLPARPAVRISEVRPAATTMRVEPTAVQKDEGVLASEAAPQPSPEVATVVPPAEAPGAGETTELAAAPQQSPEAPTEALVESLDVSEARRTETARLVVEKQAGAPKAMPSQTFARAAAPPAPPTATLETEPSRAEFTDIVQPSPTVEAAAAAAPTATPLPAPTNTPRPPTATPLPTPTNTPLPPTATPSPTSTVVPSVPTEQLPSPPPASGLWAFLEALRPSLPWIELTLALTVALLLAATLWLRRKQRLA